MEVEVYSEMAYSCAWTVENTDTSGDAPRIPVVAGDRNVMEA